MALESEFQVELKGIDNSSPAYHKAVKAAEMAVKAALQFNKTIDVQAVVIQKNSVALNQATKAYDQTTAAAARMSVGIGKSGKSMDESANIAQRTAVGFSLVVRSINDVIEIFDKLTDDKFLRKLENILKILGGIARLKGAPALGNFFTAMAENVGKARVAVNAFNEEAEGGFENLAAKIKIAEAALKLATFTVGVFATAGAVTGVLVMVGRMDLLTASAKAVTDKFAILNSGMARFGDAIHSKAIPGFIGFIEKTAIASTVMASLGFMMKDSEDKFTSFAGKALIVSGILFGGVAAAGVYLSRVVGQLAIDLGVKLFNAMSQFEEKANKIESGLISFIFTIQAFGQELGVGAAGSLSRWNDLVNEVAENTSFAVVEARKAIQFLVSEAPALGLVPDQISSIVRGAADVAESAGADYVDTVKAITKGLAGQTLAAFNLGINMKDTALSHSELGKAALAANGELTAQEKVMSRLEIAQDRFRVVQGAAIVQMDTIEGASRNYEKRLVAIQVALGEAGFFTRNLIKLKTQLLGMFLDLPKPLVSFVGTLGDLSAILLVVGGSFLAFGTTLGLIVTVFKVFNFLVAESAIVQTLFGGAMDVVSRSLGIQTVAVTGSTTAWAAMAQVTKGAAVSIGVSLLSALKASTLAVLKFTGALLVNPLFLVGAALVAGLIIAGKAFAGVADDIDEATKAIHGNTAALEKADKSLNIFENAWEGIKSAIVGAFQAVMEFTKLLISGALKAVNLLFQGITLLQLKFADTDEEVAKLSKDLRDNADSMDILNKVSDKALAGMLGAFDDVAMAAGRMGGKLKDNIDMLFEFILKGKAIEKVFRDVDDSFIRISVLGSDFEKAAAGVVKVKQELLEAQKAFKPFGENAKEQKDVIKRLREEVIRSQAEIKKMIRDVSSDWVKQIQGQASARMSLANDTIGLINDERDAQLSALEDVKDGLKEIGGFGAEQATAFERLTQGIADLAGQKILAERTKALKSAQDPLLDQLKSLTSESLKLEAAQDRIGKSELELIELAKDLAMNRADSLKTALIAAGVDKRIVEDQINRFKAAIESAAKTDADAIELPVTLGDVGNGLMGAFDSLVDGLNGGFAESASSFAIMMNDITFDDMKNGLADGFKSAVDFLKDGIGSISLKSIGSTIFEGGKLLGKAAIGIGMALSPGNIDKLSDGFSSLSNLPDMIISSLSNLDKILSSFMDKFPQAVERFLKAFPKLIDKLVKALPGVIKGIIDSLPEIVQTIAKELPKLIGVFMDALTEIFQNADEILMPLIEALPVIFEKILEKLPAMLDAIFDSLPEIMRAIFKMIPSLVESFANNIGPIVESLIGGFIGAVGEIVVAFIDEFLVKGGLERIVGALLRAVPRIAVALVAGIVRGLQKFFAAIGDLFSGREVKVPAVLADLPEKLGDAASKFASDVKREADELFRVLDLKQETRGIDLAERIGDAIRGGVAAFTIRFKGIMDALSRLWMWIKENIWDPFLDALGAIWMWVKTNVWDPVLDALGSWVENLKAAWNSVIVFFQGFGLLISNAWKSVLAVFSSLGATVSSAWQGVMDLFGGLIQKVANAFSPVTDLFYNKLPGLFDKAFKGVKDFLNKFKFPSLGGSGGGGGLVSGTGTALDNFQFGGYVGNAIGKAIRPLTAQNGRMIDFSPVGVDTVPVLARPGEAFISRESTRANSGLIGEMIANPGGTVGGQPIVVQNTFNIKTNLTAESIKRDITPKVVTELRKLSKQGVRLVDPKGVRV